MSTLKGEFAQLRAAQPAAISCVTGSAKTPALVIRTWSGETWVLPWSRFQSARYVGEDAGGHMVLSFTGHCVTVRGANLRGLLDDIAKFRVDCLRDLPPQYRSGAGAGAPFIADIEIRPMADASFPLPSHHKGAPDG